MSAKLYFDVGAAQWVLTNRASSKVLTIDDSGNVVFPKTGGVSFAKYGSSAGSGIKASSARTSALVIYADDGGVETTSLIRGLRVRFLTCAAVTTSGEYFAIHGQHISNAGMNFQHNDAAVTGSKEITTVAGTFSGTSGDNVHACIYARMGITVTGTTVAATGTLAGVQAMSSVTDGYVTVTSGGVFAAYYAGKHTGCQSWDYGLYIADGAADNGIQITNTAVAADGQYGIRIQDTYTYKTGGAHKGISSEVTYTPATSGYGCSIGVAGKVILHSNFTGGTSYMWGVQGQLQFDDEAVVNNANSVFAAGRFVITAEATPTFTEAEEICGLYVDNLCAYNMSAITTGNVSLLYLANQAASVIDYFIHVQGGSGTPVDNLFYFEGDANYITQGADSADCTHRLKCYVEGFGTRYVHLFSS